MECPNCQHNNPEHSKFCNECGHNLNDIGRALPPKPNQRRSYTPKHLLDKILKPESSIVGEKKQVTVLFADVANFTAMSEKLAPESIHQIMDGTFEILIDEIHGNKGTINQFTGDGVMALFGAPLALEHHALNACNAALSIQKMMGAYQELLQTKYSINFQLRIGINSGAVVVGAIGDDLRMDYTAVGNTTNLAARMEKKAKPGTVLVALDTYRKVSEQFEFKSIGMVEVKGKTEPLNAYELISDKVYSSESGQNRQIGSELVGRYNELKKLKAQVKKVIDGEGSVVNVIGEAGIGKSRLISELKNSLSVEQVNFIEGRAISFGRNLSFHPVIDLLKNWAAISEDDTEALSLVKLEKAARSISPQEADEIVPFVAALMGMKQTGKHAERVKGIEGESLEKLILKNIKELLTRAAKQKPLVIVVEDLHWADTSSVRMLESVFRLAETQRILFVNVYRPDYNKTDEGKAVSLLKNLPAYYVDINLEPLDEKMSEQLIDNLLDVLKPHNKIKNKIIQRTGGNPFFIEEVVRSFFDKGTLVNKNGRFELTKKIDDLVIPNTINDVLMARIDLLDDETRNLVKVASVIGRRFFHRILSEVAKSIQNIDKRLSYLIDIQLIRGQKRMEEMEYLFKHALAQEAAYESILVQKRKELHLKVADTIERVFGERLPDFYGILAYHYTRGGDEKKTEEYLIRAGEEALKSSASSEALYYFREALQLYLKKYGGTADPERVTMIERNIAYAYFNKGQYTEAEDYLNKVLTFFGEGEIKRSAGGGFNFISKLLCLLAGMYISPLRWKKNPSDTDSDINHLFYMKLQCLSVTNAEKFFFETINASRRIILFDISKLKKGINLFCGYSALFSWGGISFSLSKKILKVVQKKVDIKEAYSALVFNTMSLVHGYLSGDWGKVTAYDCDLTSKNLKTIDIMMPTYISFLALTEMAKGNYDGSKKLVNDLLEISNVYEHGYATVAKYYDNAYLLLKFRMFEKAMSEIDEGISSIKETTYSIWLLAMYSMKARLQLMSGDFEAAKNSLNYATDIKSEVHAPPFYLCNFLRSRFLFCLAKLEQSIRSGDAASINENNRNVLKAAKKMIDNSRKVAFEKIETYRLMGIYYQLINKQKKAAKWFDRSIKEGEQLNGRLELSRSYFEMGKLLLDPGSNIKKWNSLTAKQYLEKARALFQEMNLEYDLDKLEKIHMGNFRC